MSGTKNLLRNKALIVESNKVFIVESPNKVKTISSYFKPEDKMKVIATCGHLRSLPSKPNSITFANNTVDFLWIPNKANVINNLINEITHANEIILATDCDREGEAIAWHVTNIMRENNIYDNKEIYRIVFQEITPKSIKNALSDKKNININLVNAYLARLTEDYSCGFRITEKMWSKLKCGYSSAGRVQSPTLELIRQREEEIKHFIQKTYYSILCWFKKDKDESIIIEEGELTKLDGKKIDQDTLPNKEKTEEVIKNLKNISEYVILESEIKKTKSRKIEPLKTSTLQQSANTKLNFDGKRTMRIAQSLYEGISLDNKITGLITYMRTDSSFLNEEFVKETQEYIKNKYGQKYVEVEKQTAKKAKNAQEAHEAIRPTNVNLTPDSVSSYLTKEQLQLYELIWNTTVASLITLAEFANLNVILQAKNNENIQIKKSFKSLIFDGNLIFDYKYSGEVKDLSILQNIYKKGELFHITNVKNVEHKTMAPPRYNSGSLVKKMEEEGIGRPSTYVTTVDMLLKYQYCLPQNNSFVLTAKGAIVSLFLQKYFGRFLKIESTNIMENALDEIAKGEKDWLQEVLTFNENLNNNVSDVQNIPITEVLNALNDPFFKNFNKTKKCSKCNDETIHLTVRMSLFAQCQSCNSNFTLDNIIGGDVNYDINDVYSVKKSIYGPYIENKQSGKKITLPAFLDMNGVTLEIAQWLDKLPLQLNDNCFLKVGKYGFYLDTGEKKYPVSEKSIELLMNFSKEQFLEFMKVNYTPSNRSYENKYSGKKNINSDDTKNKNDNTKIKKKTTKSSITKSSTKTTKKKD